MQQRKFPMMKLGADDYCDRGRCSPGSGTTATRARVAGPGQWQLGPPPVTKPTT